jgi:hypothetical protein
MGIGATNNRTTMIAASITTFASGDRLAEYCNSFPLTVVPIVVPTPDIESTKRAIAVADQQRRDAELATRVATEAKQEADRFAASLEATRTAEAMMLEATRTAELAQYCREWEGMVLNWVKEGHNYDDHIFDPSAPAAPTHPELSPQLADDLCITNFPWGRLYRYNKNNLTRGPGVEVGTDARQLLPGLYRYQTPSGDDRVEAKPLLQRGDNVGCLLKVNFKESNEVDIPMLYGEPFEFRFRASYNYVAMDRSAWGCRGFLHRVGDRGSAAGPGQTPDWS